VSTKQIQNSTCIFKRIKNEKLLLVERNEEKGRRWKVCFSYVAAKLEEDTKRWKDDGKEDVDAVCCAFVSHFLLLSSKFQRNRYDNFAQCGDANKDGSSGSIYRTWSGTFQSTFPFTLFF
jgi:hypothetical protein